MEGLIVTTHVHYMVLKLMAQEYCITQTKFMVSKPRQKRTNSSQSNQFHSYNTSNSQAYHRLTVEQTLRSSCLLVKDIRFLIHLTTRSSTLNPSPPLRKY